LAQVFDVAFGVCRDLAGISVGQAGLGSGGAAQVGLVPSKMTPKAHEYKPSGSRNGSVTSGPVKGVTPMLGPRFESEQVDPVLLQIYEGMAVHDQTGKRIGTVEYVYLGEVAESREEYSYDEQPLSTPTSSEGSLIEEFAKAILLTEQVSDIWRKRLLSYGFIRINSSGLFTSDRYALPSQIAGVANDRVLLYVDRDELIKA
jgi:hypothetical protein